MDLLQKILDHAGVKSYEELTPAEKETYHNWEEALKQRQVTIETIKENISAMKNGIEQELSAHDLDPKQDLFLKARLRNYLLLEAFLQSPEKAEKALDRTLSGMVRKV